MQPQTVYAAGQAGQQQQPVVYVHPGTQPQYYAQPQPTQQAGMQQQMMVAHQTGVPMQTQNVQSAPTSPQSLSAPFPSGPTMSPTKSSESVIPPDPTGKEAEKAKVSNSVHEMYAGVLFTRGIDPFEINVRYSDANFVIALQKDIVHGKIAFSGSLLRDFKYWHMNNHILMSCFWVDPYHPLGSINRIFLFFFYVYVTGAFFLSTEDITDPDERNTRVFWVSVIMWVLMTFLTWMLTGQWLIGRTKSTQCFYQSCACLCCYWSKWTKPVWIGFFLILWIVGQAQNSRVLPDYWSSLALEMLVTDPLFGFICFCYSYLRGSEMQMIHRKQGKELLDIMIKEKDTIKNDIKPYNRFVVTILDSIFWKALKDDHPITTHPDSVETITFGGNKVLMPPPTWVFQKFDKRYSVRKSEKQAL